MPNLWMQPHSPKTGSGAYNVNRVEKSKKCDLITGCDHRGAGFMRWWILRREKSGFFSGGPYPGRVHFAALQEIARKERFKEYLHSSSINLLGLPILLVASQEDAAERLHGTA